MLMATKPNLQDRVADAPLISSEGPLPLYRDLPPAPVFPIKALGPILGSAASAIEAVIQCPMESVATVAGVAGVQLETENADGLEFGLEPQTSAISTDDPQKSVLAVVPATVATSATDDSHERIARARLAPSLILREWKANIAAADPGRPPESWHPNRWRQLCDDAAWVLASFGEKAARDGWGSSDLYGLWVGKPGWGA